MAFFWRSERTISFYGKRSELNVQLEIMETPVLTVKNASINVGSGALYLWQACETYCCQCELI